MRRQLRAAVVMTLGLTVLTGVVYPLSISLVVQSVFNSAANGSLIRRDGKPVGSEWIGQSFSRPKHFWGRLSATGPFPYNAAASGGSNFGPMHNGLKEAVEARIDALSKYRSPNMPIPVDLVTASASGLDPHISPAAAEFQVARVADARKLEEAVVRKLVTQNTEGRQFGVLGEPRVHVLRLNLALDQLQPDE